MGRILTYIGLLALFGGLSVVFIYNEMTKTDEGRVILSNYKRLRNQGGDNRTATQADKYDCRLLINRPFDFEMKEEQILNPDYDLRNCK